MKPTSALPCIWRWFSNAVTIIVVSGVIAYAVVWSLSGPKEGPVVEVISGPGRERMTVPYGGTITYDLTTRRLESCPGAVTRSFTRRATTNAAGGEIKGLRYESSQPVMAQDIRPATTSTITIDLPPIITPGIWNYMTAIDSRCPMRRQTDVTAQFEIEVLPLQETGADELE